MPQWRRSRRSPRQHRMLRQQLGRRHVVAHKHGDAVHRDLHRLRAPADAEELRAIPVGPPARGPGGQRRQVDLHRGQPGREHGGHEQRIAEHVGALDAPRRCVLRKVDEERPHDRAAVARSPRHLGIDVRPQPLPRPERPIDDRRVGGAEAPRLVRAVLEARVGLGAAAVAVGAHDRHKPRPLQPPDVQLLVSGVVHVQAGVAARVERPPHNPAELDVEPGPELQVERGPRRQDVARPDRAAPPLRARPARAPDRQHARPVGGVERPPLHQRVVHAALVVPGVHHADLVEAPCREHRVDPGERRGLANPATALVGIEPEGVDPDVLVVLHHPVGEVPPGVGVERVVCGPPEPALPRRVAAARLGEGQQPGVVHRPKVLRGGLEHWPHRDHHLVAVAENFAHHRCRVGPVGGVEPPVARVRRERGVVVDHDHGERQVPRLELPRHVQHLVLGDVPVLALPKAARISGPRRGVPGGLGVPGHDVHRGGAGRH
mmetsp:Transcript_101025/g.306519  ORF Transcript_101025/g.306519 Transcript_101025/m.306519 type:complete len:490 (-) Transcript_101025:40-1509(-)